MKIFTEHPHWTTVLDVCTRLSKEGFRAYLAGGCVRDALMGTKPNDFDVATDATPEKVQELFPRSLDVGKAFGVIIIPFDDFQVEVATFRTDANYKDGRRPESVTFSSPEEDAKRRDFTVNALFYDWVEDKVLDFVGGAADIEEKLIRAVGDPDTRFKEDHLRLVRAVRFRAQLNFEIEAKTLKSVRKLSQLAGDVSKERVREELLKLLRSPSRAEGVRLLQETGLMEAILPSLAKLVKGEYFEKTLAALSQSFQLTQEVNLWAALLLYVGHEKIKIKNVLKELKCSNYTVSYVEKLVAAYWTSLHAMATPSVLKRLIAQFSIDLLEIHRIQGEVDSSMSRWAEFAVLPQTLPDAWITSEDLKAYEFKEGPEFGKVLDRMFDLQLNGELEDRNAALELLKSMSNKSNKPDEYLKETPDGVLVCLHVVPGARKTEFSGLHGDRLKLRVAAPPVDDAANRAIESYLNKFFNVKTEIVSGGKSRKKDVLVRGLDVESIRKQLRATDGKPVRKSSKEPGNKSSQKSDQ